MADDDIDNYQLINALKQSSTHSDPDPQTPYMHPNVPKAAKWLDDFSQGGLQKAQGWQPNAVSNVLQNPDNQAAMGAIFAGPRALGSDLKAYEKAQDMILRGSAPEKVMDRTGWFNRPGGESDAFYLSREIPDTPENAMQPVPKLSKIKHGEPYETTIGKAITYPGAFNAYPQLQDSKLILDPTYNEGAGGGVYYPGKGDIRIGSQAEKTGLTPFQMKILAHEMQHGVQDLEGWGTGTNSRDIANRLRKMAEGSNPFWEKLSPAELAQTTGISDPRMNQNILDYLNGIRKGSMNHIGEGSTPYKMYWNHPDEVEARNAEHRLSIAKGYYPDWGLEHTDYDTLQNMLKNKGVSLDLQYGNSGRPNIYPLRQWGTQNMVDPNTLDPQLREMYERLPSQSRRNFYGGKDVVTHLVGDPKYPWKTEDIPRSKVNEYEKWLP